MGRVGRIISALGISAAVLSAGITAAYLYFDTGITDEEASVDSNVQNQRQQEEYKDLNTAAQEASISGGLLDSAVFTYELYNETADTTDTIQGECPYELIGKNMVDVKDYYPDWQVMSFSSDKVLLRKNIGSENEDRYVVGVYNDCVAVFYENSEEGIYMMTEIPVNSLEPDKQNMLNEGIYVEGKERLNRILEDYSS